MTSRSNRLLGPETQPCVQSESHVVTPFAYYLGPPQIDQLYCLLYGGPSDQFFYLLYMGPLRLVSVLTIWGPLRSVLAHTIWGLHQINFFAYYMGALSDQFLHILFGGPFRSVSYHTIWGSPQVNFFAY